MISVYHCESNLILELCYPRVLWYYPAPKIICLADHHNTQVVNTTSVPNEISWRSEIEAIQATMVQPIGFHDTDSWVGMCHMKNLVP